MMTELEEMRLIEILRQDVQSKCIESLHFFIKTFWDVIISDDYIDNWHIDYICQELEKVAKNVLRMPVRVGYPRGVTGLIDEIENPSFTAAVGSLLYSAKMIRSNSLLSFDNQKGNIKDVLNKLFDKAKSFLP